MRGKEGKAEIARTLIGDHPRTCGEKCKQMAFISIKDGITPAHAGKSSCRLPCLRCPGDHPRTCGEKLVRLAFICGILGSPPHMRGKAYMYICIGTAARITPAHAGKRLKRSRSTVPHAAIVPLFPSVCNKPAGSDGSPAGHDAPPFLPIENAVPASPAYNLRSL